MVTFPVHPIRLIPLTMSNYNHDIDPGMAEALQAAPNQAVSEHAAWEFHGTVWWDGEQFCEIVMRFWKQVDLVKAPTLDGLMTEVNNRWGWD